MKLERSRHFIIILFLQKTTFFNNIHFFNFKENPSFFAILSFEVLDQ